MANNSKVARKAQVQVLKNVRQDLHELGWEKLADDNIHVLVRKTDVLQIVQDWIEHCLNPEMNEATG